MDEFAATEQAYKNGYEKGYADAKEELVRCKDCRKCSIWEDVITRQPHYTCRLWHGATRDVDADSFCDAGERGDGE